MYRFREGLTILAATGKTARWLLYHHDAPTRSRYAWNQGHFLGYRGHHYTCHHLHAEHRSWPPPHFHILNWSQCIFNRCEPFTSQTTENLGVDFRFLTTPDRMRVKLRLWYPIQKFYQCEMNRKRCLRGSSVSGNTEISRPFNDCGCTLWVILEVRYFQEGWHDLADVLIGQFWLTVMFRE